MTTATYKILIDANDDGVPETDITSYLLTRTALDFARGNDQIRSLSPGQAGTFYGEFDDGILSSLVNGRLIQVIGTYSGTDHPLWFGVMEEPTYNPDPKVRSVGLAANGIISKFANVQLSLSLYSAITTDVAIGHILDAVGWPANVTDYIAALSGLVSYLKLNETSGATAADTSGHANGTYVGSPALAFANLDDQLDGAPDFDGSTQYVSGSDASLPAGSSARTIIMRVNLDVVNVVDQPLFGYGSVGFKQGFLLEANNAHLRVGFSGSNSVASTGSIVAGQDTTVIVSIASDGSMTYYLQGVAAGTSAAIPGINTVLSGFRVMDAIAGWGLASKGNGRAAHVTVLNRTITAAEAATIHLGFTHSTRRLDTGLTTLNWWPVDDSFDAYAMMERLRFAEGPGAALYEDGSGRIVFKNRQAKFLESRSTISQNVFTSSGAAPVFHSPMAVLDARKNVINSATISITKRAAAALSTIWTLGEDVVVPASGSVSYIAKTENADPFLAAVIPVSGTDYTLVGTNPTITLSRTSGCSTVVTITSNGAATLSNFGMRAQLVSVTNSYRKKNQVDESASIAVNGTKTIPDDAPTQLTEIDTTVGQDFADAFVSNWGNGRKQVSITVMNDDPTALLAALSREIGDRVTIDDTDVTITDLDYYIESIKHEITAAGLIHHVVFGCEEVAGNGYFILDTDDVDSLPGLGY